MVQKSETLTNNRTSNLMYQSEIGTNTPWTSNVKFYQPHPTPHTLNLNNQTKNLIENDKYNTQEDTCIKLAQPKP